MKITANTVVEFCYDLEVEGQIVDHTTKERPLDYIHATGSLLPKLEAAIEGMEPGDKFDVTLAPTDAYGELDPENYILMPKSAFMIDGEMRNDLMVPGTVVPLVNQMGGVTPGTILEVLEDVVKIDINHQMAGKTLRFTGEILTVREATEKELTEGLHGEYVHTCGGCHGHDGCGGGCHGGDGDCGCGDHDHDGGCCGGHEGGCGCH